MGSRADLESEVPVKVQGKGVSRAQLAQIPYHVKTSYLTADLLFSPNVSYHPTRCSYPGISERLSPLLLPLVPYSVL